MIFGGVFLNLEFKFGNYDGIVHCLSENMAPNNFLILRLFLELNSSWYF